MDSKVDNVSTKLTFGNFVLILIRVFSILEAVLISVFNAYLTNAEGGAIVETMEV